jgi:hypothetical protein
MKTFYTPNGKELNISNASLRSTATENINFWQQLESQKDWETEAKENIDFWLFMFNQTHEETQKLPIYWSVQDFETLAIQNFEELKKDHPEEFKRFENWEQIYDKTKFPEALKKMIDKHDCEVGITWLTLEHYLMECKN